MNALASFSFGLLSSLHCVGMCGALVGCATLRARRPLPSTALYHAGRIGSYAVLGFAAATAGQSARALFHLADAQMVLARGMGVVIAIVGLLILSRRPTPRALLPLTSVLARLMAPAARSAGPADALLLGVLTAFLPCGLTLAMLLQAAAGADPPAGFSGMLVFGLGTLPALLVTGAAAARVSPRVRAWGDRVGAGALVVLGVVMIVRGAGNACSLLHG